MPKHLSCGDAASRGFFTSAWVSWLWIFTMFFFLSNTSLVGVAVMADTPNDNADCPSYGCPILPLDINYNEDAKSALEALRKDAASLSSSSSSVWDILKQSTDVVVDDEDGVAYGTLTLMGYKGSRQEVNQDRALVISPFVNENEQWTGRLVGVFDGHGYLGETVSQHVIEQLPVLLQNKIQTATDEQEVKTALMESFVELDKTAPNAQQGGCTATAVLQLQSPQEKETSKVYVANAGDSRSLVALFDRTFRTVKILYATREDKPDLPDERARVEAAGGRVSLPRRSGGTSRVMFQHPQTGQFAGGLAMSRSIGDWQVGRFGVIPDPLVQVLDLTREREAYCSQQQVGAAAAAEMQVDAASGNVQSVEEEEEEQQSCQVEFFAVAATDGMLDYLPLQSIAEAVAKALYPTADPDNKGSEGHLLITLEQLILASAEGWNREHGGEYRDDIAIAVSKL